MASNGTLQAIRPGRRFLSVALLLVAAVAGIYGQTFRHEFITFDDNTYILNHPEVTNGLSWEGLRWSFGYHEANWHPLTWLSHMADSQLFGLWAGGHHLVGVGFHAANAVLLLGVLTAMTGAFWRSAAVAALFALHPQRVESVAWAAERKDVLSALFWLLTMGAYLRYVRRPGAGRYLATLGLFVLGLAAKPMLVTLPFALLLLDWWPLGRARIAGGPGRSRTVPAGFGAWRPLLVEKAPFFLISLLSSLVTLQAQTLNVVQTVSADFTTRLSNAAVSYIRYLGAFVWPQDLAFLYPYPRAGVPLGTAAAAGAALVLGSAAVVVLGRRRPQLPVGWLWFLGTLVPVIGLIQVGGQSRSDRYTYLSEIGIAVALVWLAREVWPRGAGARRALAAVSVAALAALAVSSAAYVRVWRDSVTLYEYALRVTRDNDLAMNNLGEAYMEAGRLQEAADVLQQAVRVNPENCLTHYNLGTTRLHQNLNEQALGPLTRALECNERQRRGRGKLADTHNNLGIAYLRLWRFADAERHYRALLELDPAYPGADTVLRELRARQGK